MTQHNTIEDEITIIPIVEINLQVGKSRFADRTLNKQDMQNNKTCNFQAFEYSK